MAKQSENILDDFSTSRVPLDKRNSVFTVSMVAAGYCVSMSGMYTGASLATGLNLKQAIIAAFIGNLILSVYGGLVGVIGTREGLSSSRLAIYSFGRSGYKIVALVLAVTMGGWYAIQAGLFGNTLSAMFPNGGFLTNPRVASVWGGLLMMVTGIIGMKALALLSNISVPMITIAALIGTYAGINYIGGGSELFDFVPPGTWTTSSGIVTVVGSFAAGAAAQADITRYAKDNRASIFSTVFGYSIANTFIILAGYIMVASTGLTDLPLAMVALGLGSPALVILVLAQWTTNDNNLYTSSLGFSQISHANRSKMAMVVGFVGAILAGLGIANYFTNFLNILGTGIPPMAGVIIADYYLLKDKNYSIDEENLPEWNISALLAWFIGALVGFLLPVGIASLNGLITAFALYLLFNRNSIK